MYVWSLWKSRYWILMNTLHIVTEYDFFKKLSYGSIKITSPREAIQKAYQSKLINDEQIWISMLKDINLTSHTYEETTAKEIFEHIQIYYSVMRTTYQSLVQYVEQLI